jgi:tRNA modification GTPase
MNNAQTIYALSSGSLPAAIAVVRLSGPSALKTLSLLGVKDPEPRKLVLSRLKQDKKEIIDIALVCYFPKLESITGEDLVELHLHGSIAVVDDLFLFFSSVKDLRPAEPGEFTRRSLTNGKMGLTEVEGLADLIAAETKQQRTQSLSLLKGELSAKYYKWRKKLILLRAEIEAILDFSDEGDVLEQFKKNNFTQSICSLIKDIDKDIAIGAAGERLRKGLKIAIIGPPNVGKSSLINVLLKEERAIVSAYAGTTRDTIEARLNLEGVPVTIYDTAGIRKTNNKIEEEGVKRSKIAAEAADIIVFISNAKKQNANRVLVEPIYKKAKVIYVHNKIDLIKERNLIKKEGFGVSCKTKEGLNTFLEGLSKEVKKLTHASDLAVGPNRTRHISHLKETKDSLELALIEAKADRIEVSADFIRASSASLGRIIGLVDIEDVLDELFLGFCIGK